MDPSNAGRGDNIPLGVTFAIITFACFSTADAFVKWLSSGFSVVQLMLFTSLAAMVPVAYMARQEGGVRALMPKNTRLVLFRAVLMALDSLCAYFAFSRLPLANVYTLIFAAPLLVAALAAPVVAPFQFSQMVWAVIYGVLVFGAVPDTFVVCGSLIVVASGLYIFLRGER